MFPPYRYVDTQPQSFPDPRNYMPYPYHYYPGQEAFTPQAFSSTHRPNSFAFWPYNGNMSNQANVCSGCCIPSHPPRYCNFIPPYPLMKQPPHFYYHGTPHHDPYPTYFIPPYPFDQARHDNDVAKSHCCGCLHHPWKRMDNQSLKVEEQNPEGEQKSDSSSGLIHPPDYHHPVVWVPASLFNNMEANKNPQLHPSFSKEWIPLDMNSLKSLMQSVDQKDKMLADKKKNQFSWPFIWMPGQDYSQVVKDLKEISDNPESVEHAPSQLKIIPLRLPENVSPGDKPETLEDQSKPSVDQESLSGKESKVKTIPVKQLNEMIGEIISTVGKQNVKDGEKSSILEKEKEDGKKKSESKQSAQTKSPKLPPICLRIDPMPRKKSTNAASRLSSPPGHKDKERVNHDETQGKSSSPIYRKDGVLRKEIQAIDSSQNSEAIEVNKKSQNTSNFLEKPGSAVGKQQQKVSMGEETDKVLEAAMSKEHKTEQGKTSHQSSKIEGETTRKEALKSVGGQKKKECKILSPRDAAILIQAAYKGFEVRRWQPLEKLSKIKNIREQLEEVRKQFEDLEASSVDMDKKQLMVIEETAMSLLLQLDTLQGQHQSVSEARRAVTKDIIKLQEKLDDLSKQDKREQSMMDDGLKSSAGSGADSSAVESHISQVPNQLTHKESNSEDTSVATLEEQEKPAKEEISESLDIADTSESLAGGAVLSASPKEDGETHCLNEERGSEVDKSLDRPAQREKLSSDMELSLVDEAVRMHSAQISNESSCVEYEMSIKIEESGKQSATESGDTIKETSLSDGMVSKTEFLDSANHGSDSETELVKDLFVESSDKADVKPKAELDQVCVPPVEGEMASAPIAEVSDFTSEVSADAMVGEAVIFERKEPELEAVIPVSESAMIRDESLPSTMDEVRTATNEDILVKTKDIPIDVPASNNGGNLEHNDTDNAVAAPLPSPREGEKKLLEENENLRETLERLLEVGKTHLGQISDLNGRIKDLEKKLSQKKKVRAKRYWVRRRSLAH